MKKLTCAFGVSGNEEEIRDVIINEIKDKVDEIKVDVLGNLICVKKGKAKKIMLTAHMDEVGIMVVHIDEKGFIRFSSIGGISLYGLIGQRVRFKNGIIGVIYCESKEDMKSIKISNLYIDIGEKSKEAVEKKISFGDVACFVGDTIETGDMIISKALDNRVGCAILIDIINKLPQTDNELYFVFTVQEELGLRGAKTAAFNIMPDFAIGVDVTPADDIPGCKLRDVQCGAGPAIKIKDKTIICHKEVKNLLEDAAKQMDIPYQYEILDNGGSDIGSIHLVGGGIPSGAISIPVRYIHTPVEMVNMLDVENAVKLLSRVISM